MELTEFQSAHLLQNNETFQNVLIFSMSFVHWRWGIFSVLCYLFLSTVCNYVLHTLLFIYLFISTNMWHVSRSSTRVVLRNYINNMRTNFLVVWKLEKFEINNFSLSISFFVSFNLLLGQYWKQWKLENRSRKRIIFWNNMAFIQLSGVYWFIHYSMVV